jgi:hypothetical protein
MTLASLNILAFAWHTALELLEPPWIAAREAATKRTSFFAHLAAITAYAIFPSWLVFLQALMTFTIPRVNRAASGSISVIGALSLLWPATIHQKIDFLKRRGNLVPDVNELYRMRGLSVANTRKSALLRSYVVARHGQNRGEVVSSSVRASSH